MEKKKLAVKIDRIKPFIWKFHIPDTDKQLFNNLKPENEDPKISIDDNIEPEKKLDDDDLQLT